MQGELQVMFEELNLSISLEEIKDGVRQLRNGCKCRSRSFLKRIFEKGTNELITYMHSLFNKIFELGYFPARWTVGQIIPIFKKG